MTGDIGFKKKKKRTRRHLATDQPKLNETELNVQKEGFSVTLKTSLQCGDLLTCTIYYVMLKERKKKFGVR